MNRNTLALVASKIGLTLAVILLLVWSVGPIYWSLVTSLTSPWSWCRRHRISGLNT